MWYKEYGNYLIETKRSVEKWNSCGEVIHYDWRDERQGRHQDPVEV
jgi:hypothetical protein